jgi:DNA-binding SARP family transcriptional activator/class 3 adenylate cyclase
VRDVTRGAEPSELPTGTVAFLFTDVEGSTELLRLLGDGYAAVVDEHRELLVGVFEAHDGRVVDSQGDSFFVAFSRVKDAAAAAADAQHGFAAHTWPQDVDVRVRMGLHAGEPLVADERYVGLGVHRAARICAVAHGGQVLLSQAAASLLADNEPPDVRLRELGEHRLKDFDRPERLSQLVIEGLPSDFPPLTERQADGASRTPEFRILGPLEVVGPKGPLALGGQRPRALLALLLIHAGEVLSSDRIVEELWGEQRPKTATTSLQNFVVQLRKVLPKDVLVTKPTGYVLRIEPGQLDLGRFEQLVAESRGQSAKQRSRLLREALALWRGPALVDFAYESFAQSEIRRLEELRLEALEERIDADLEVGGGSELVGELEQLVGEHPLRERLRGQLMLSLYRAGRQAEALQAYLHARRMLVEELGIDPSPALQQLYRSVIRQERVLEPPSVQHPVEDHFGDVIEAFLAGRLVVIVGAGVNHPGELEQNGLPGPAEVAAHLARCFECPPDHMRDLAHIAEYVALTKGVGPLYDELHTLFDRESALGPVHRSLAELAGLLRARGGSNQLIVTTNFDDVLEQAFREAGEDFDVVSYLALGPNRGKFLHVGFDGAATLVEVPNAYADISLERRPVILKIHGGIDRRPEREWESFVVSEDDHIDYLAQAEIAVVLPVTLAAKLRRSHFLFLGYPLHAWSLRVFLHRVWGRERIGYRSWAIGPKPEAIEQELWRQRGIDLFDAPLDEYVDGLRSRIAAELPA